ncbi:MAG: hypothetical protein OFPI_31730 [Osedax symbiont Rs2]|nr:MAG: hypothetical protein OFPI_31730 [Osedax symbiont Rs2]
MFTLHVFPSLDVKLAPAILQHQRRNIIIILPSKKMTKNNSHQCSKASGFLFL